MDVGNDFYLITFQSVSNYEKVVHGDPWWKRINRTVLLIHDKWH